MNVHLLRNEGVEDALYFGVHEFLQHIPGPFTFLVNEEPEEITITDEVRILERSEKKFIEQESMIAELSSLNYSKSIELISWENIFGTCRAYREQEQKKKEEPIVLLTDYGNYKNWFSGFDKGERNYFIHAEEWDAFVEGDPRYPIAYQVVTLLLKQEMFANSEELLKGMHQESIGCVMDFCKNKHEIGLKMRTADICADCQQTLRARNVPHAQLRYTFDMLEAIRRQLLFRERFSTLRKPLRLEFRGRKMKPVIPELGDLHIPLTPTEIAVYVLFMRHPEGLRITEIIDHRSELLGYMQQVSRNDDPASIVRMVDELCNAEKNALSERMSKIRGKLVRSLGSDLAEYYSISGPNGGEKKIKLPVELRG
jgi:hypothetical protein